jgi:hypothetical protein
MCSCISCPQCVVNKSITMHERQFIQFHALSFRNLPHRICLGLTMLDN